MSSRRNGKDSGCPFASSKTPAKRKRAKAFSKEWAEKLVAELLALLAYGTLLFSEFALKRLEIGIRLPARLYDANGKK